MRSFSRSKMSIGFTIFALVVVVAGLMATGALHGSINKAQAASPSHMYLNCAAGATTCTEVWDHEAVFGKDHYIGHDEPSTLFYSNQAGSGNQMRYTLVLPDDPSPAQPNEGEKSF